MKLTLLQEHLKKKKIDYLMLTNTDPHFTYFTGLKTLAWGLLFIPKKGKPLLFFSSLDKEKVSSKTRNILIKKPWERNLKKYLKLKTLAYNSSNLTLSFYKKLKKIFSRTKLKDLTKFLPELRQEKTEKEIIYLRKAARLTDKAFQQIREKLKQGRFKTENDIKFYLERFALAQGTELSFPPIIASGKNTKNPHHQTSNKKLGKGFLLIDFGISYRNYCSDMTRMLYLGQPSRKELGIYNFLKGVQEGIIKELEVNQKAGEIEKKARKQLGKYASYFTHGLGHGVGVEIHESPSLKPESEDKIKENQVFTVEPGIYFKNFGLRIEDTVLMKGKTVVLTKVPKELIIINQCISRVRRGCEKL